MLTTAVFLFINNIMNSPEETEAEEEFPFDLYEIKSIEMWNCNQHVIVDDVESINEVAKAIYDQKPQEIEAPEIRAGYVFDMYFNKKNGGEIPMVVSGRLAVYNHTYKLSAPGVLVEKLWKVYKKHPIIPKVTPDVSLFHE